MIIGLSGKKGSGKDTVCKIIQYLCYNKIYEDNEKDSFIRFSKLFEGQYDRSGWQRKLFADKLKDIVCLLIGCTREQLEDQEFKETPLGGDWIAYKIPSGPLITEQEYLSRSERKGYGYIAEAKKVVMTSGLMMQLIDTECGRQIIHPNIWVNALMSEYVQDSGYKYEVQPIGGLGMDGGQLMKVKGNPEKYISPYPNWIITDLKFRNEAQAIKDRGGFLIRINRPSVVSTDTHESETALDNAKEWDAIITNDGSIEDLIAKVKDILQHAKII